MSAGHHDRVLEGGFRPVRRAGLSTVELDGEAVIFDEARQVVHALNLTGTLVWQVADGTSTLDELVAWLSDSFDLPFDLVHSQVSEMLLGLIDDQLLCEAMPRQAR